jgi:hypothetical protein
MDEKPCTDLFAALIWYMNYIFVVPPKCHRYGSEVRVSASFFNQTQIPYPQNYGKNWVITTSNVASFSSCIIIIIIIVQALSFY